MCNEKHFNLNFPIMKAIYLMLFLHLSLHIKSQNVGIGTSIPSAPLHIKAGLGEILRLDGSSPYISFFNGGNYKGYIWHNGTRMELGSSTTEPVVISADYTSSPAYFTPGGRLGLGIPSPSEKLDVDGNINLNGLIKVNGNAGTPGQVLTSNGTSDPNWTSVPIANNIRFCVEFAATPVITGDYADITSTAYNLNPTSVVIGASSITINRSGLYHFNIVLNASSTYSSSLSSIPWFMTRLYYGAANPFPLVGTRFMQTATSANTAFSGGENISVDLYISAPATIRLFMNLGGPAYITRSLTGALSAYLISD